MIPQFNPDVKWVMIAFNSDEDLVLLTNEGRLFIVDIYNEIRLQDKYIPGVTAKNDRVEDGRF